MGVTPMKTDLNPGETALRALSVKAESIARTDAAPGDKASSAEQASYKVTLSKGGRALQAEEAAAKGKDANDSEAEEASAKGKGAKGAEAEEASEKEDGAAAKAGKASSGAEESGDGAGIEAMIKRIKKRIEMLKKEIAKLEGDKSEFAQKRREALQGQIMELTGQLSNLLQKKAEAEKEEQPGAVH